MTFLYILRAFLRARRLYKHLQANFLTIYQYNQSLSPNYDEAPEAEGAMGDWRAFRMAFRADAWRIIGARPWPAAPHYTAAISFYFLMRMLKEAWAFAMMIARGGA